MKKFKIDVKWVEGQEPADIAAAIDDKTRAVYIETIGNPKHNVPNISAIAKVAHDAGIPLIVDNTFACGGYVRWTLPAASPACNSFCESDLPAFRARR
jgi:O-acetylhomoserine/O-acetylserine sulfhydrylase